jgi:hypothetical protein
VTWIEGTGHVVSPLDEVNADGRDLFARSASCEGAVARGGNTLHAAGAQQPSSGSMELAEPRTVMGS